MKNAVLTVTSDGDCVLVIVEGEDGNVALTITPADARSIAAKLLREAYTIDVDADLDPLFAGEVGEA